ncbi:MAG: AAA family ATPase [Bryobacterales bacterium]|nr:AAA family ATPase [Bryobacterales bacterium]
MIENLRLTNLRLFRELQVDRLERVNLFAGHNNSGKSSVLEAILLLAVGGNPSLALRIPKFRGLSHLPPGVPASFWKSMFFELDTGKPIEIKCTHSRLGYLSLTVSRESGSSLVRQGVGLSKGRGGREARSRQIRSLSLLTSKGNPGGPWGILLSWKDKNNDELRSMHLTVDSNDVWFSGEVIRLEAEFVSPSIGNIRDDSVLLGQLRERKQGSLLTEALRIIEPRLESVEDSSATGTPMIRVDIGLPELVPLSAMGEGMTRIARIVLAMSSVRGGVVLVDEIETGIHHSVLKKLWAVVAKAARTFDVQVFATTHSFECLVAAQEALPDAWRFHRLERNEDGSSRCVSFDVEDVDVVVRHGLEVR